MPQSMHSAATELAWRCYRALLPSMLIIVLHRNRVGSTCLSDKNCYRAFASLGQCLAGLIGTGGSREPPVPMPLPTPEISAASDYGTLT